VTVTKELFPRVETFHVGEVVGVAAALEPVIGVLKVLGQAEDNLPVGPLFGMVENLGDDAFTFSVEESEDDADSDAYAGINIRVGGAAVASVAVAPGGRAVFAIEPGAITAQNNYLRFKATAATGSQHGRLALASWSDDLQRWESRATT
jgi:hypothetical protein